MNKLIMVYRFENNLTIFKGLQLIDSKKSKSGLTCLTKEGGYL